MMDTNSNLIFIYWEDGWNEQNTNGKENYIHKR